MELEINEAYARAGKLAYQNALSLRDEARILLDKKHYARTVALSISSIEEQSKSFILLMVAVGKMTPAEIRFERKGREIHLTRGHKQKQLIFAMTFSGKSLLEDQLRKISEGKAGFNDEISEESFQKTWEMMKSFQKMEDVRLDAIYVSTGEEGPIRTPLESFDLKTAEKYLEMASTFLPMWKVVFDAPKTMLPFFSELIDMFQPVTTKGGTPS